MPNDTLESANGQGAQPEPQASASGASSGSQPSSNDEAWIRRLETTLSDRLEKRLQQMTDKRFDKVEKQGSDFRSFMEQVKPLLEKGLTIEQATREVELNELMESYRNGKTVPAATNAQATQASASGLVEKAMKKYGLSDTDPEVVSIMRDIPDAEERAFKLAELGVVRKSAPQPTPGAAPAPTGGTPPRPDLAAEYANKLQSVRGNVLAIAELKKEYRKKGLEVW